MTRLAPRAAIASVTRLAPRAAAESFDEALLVRRAQRGDGVAFAALVTRHESQLYRFVLRYVTNAEDAEDVLQLVFFKAYRALPLARTDVQLAPWLRRIAANASLDLLRRRKRRPEVPFDPSGVETSMARGDPDEDPEQFALRQERRRAVHDTLAAMNPRQRAALAYYALDGHTCAEIADRLGLSRAGAKSLLFRARKEFRRAYAFADDPAQR